MTYPDNMPILYRNALDAMPNDFARDVWLWAVERAGMDRMGYRADRFAFEADRLVRELTPMLDAAARIHGRSGHDPDLMGFILKRHANWRFGGNVAPTYAGAWMKADGQFGDLLAEVPDKWFLEQIEEQEA